MPAKAPPVGGKDSFLSSLTPADPDPSIYETSYHGKIPGLIADPIKKSKSTGGKYTFYFTGGSKDDLLKGIEVDLDLKMDPKRCREFLLEQIEDLVDTEGKKLIVYFPGGIPFIAGKLSDIFEKKELNVNKVIYGVLTRNIDDRILNKEYLELCNVGDPELQSLISPFCESTPKGLSDIACLLGYLNHNGIKGDLLRCTCASVIHFPPLITSMSSLINRNQIVGRDVVTICSTLFTFFRAYLPKTCPDNKVYEYALRICNLISHIPDFPDKLPITPIQVKDSDPKTKFLADLKLGPMVYFWRGDSGDDITWMNFDIVGEGTIENANKIIASFTPIAPLSMRIVNTCSIVKGKDHEYLFLMRSPSKDAKNQNNVDIIDPMTGMSESIDIEVFARDQGNTEADDIADLIDPDRVKQIIMVNFDESKSMIGDLSGCKIKPNSKECSRVTIAIQYLTSFANRAYGYRIPCIQGLVSFNNEITLRCPLSPLVPDFEEKGLKKIKPNSTTKLWDSLLFSCKQIVEFRKDEKGREIYPHAISRILVISDGEDSDSEAKVEDVVKELIKNKIIVDSVIISSEDECKMLCALCHATGGLAFRPDDIGEGISLFEESAFLNYEERKTNLANLTTKPRLRARDLKPEMVTSELMDQIRDSAKFDEEIQNKEMITATSPTSRLATPLHVCSENASAEIPSPRQRRILRELHAAAQINDSSSPDYDPDLVVYPFQANLDRWKVFIKAPEGTPYSGKWWYMYVTFPDLYPAEPPIFRFISIPYHLNVSSEGRVCLNIIEKGYIPTKHVVEILQEIKELFFFPSSDTPVDIDRYNTYRNPRRYERLAKNSTENNAKADYKDYIKDVYIDDSVNEKFTLDIESYVPPYMRSQISGKYIPPERRVVSSTGVLYDREELRQLIASNKNPICVVTGKPLTETLEQLENADDGAI